MAAHVWMASTVSLACAQRGSLETTASMTSTSATPDPAWMEAPVRTATAHTSAPALRDTMALTAR